MNKTIEVQQKTLEAMEKRVSETEKIGGMYRQLFEELPVHAAEEDRKIALAVWRFLAAGSGFAPLKTIAAKLNLNEYAVSLALDLLVKNDCAVADPHSGKETRYTAIDPPPF